MVSAYLSILGENVKYIEATAFNSWEGDFIFNDGSGAYHQDRTFSKVNVVNPTCHIDGGILSPAIRERGSATYVAA